MDSFLKSKNWRCINYKFVVKIIERLITAKTKAALCVRLAGGAPGLRPNSQSHRQFQSPNEPRPPRRGADLARNLYRQLTFVSPNSVILTVNRVCRFDVFAFPATLISPPPLTPQPPTPYPTNSADCQKEKNKITRLMFSKRTKVNSDKNEYDPVKNKLGALKFVF